MPAAIRFALLASAVWLLAGCGGSSRPAAGTQPAVSTTSRSTSALTTTARTTSRASHATSVTTAASSTTRQSANQASGGNGSGSGGAGLGPVSGSSSPGGGAINARVPAIFTLRANGALSPAQVSAPAFLAVAVRINPAGSTPHSVTIATPKPVHLQVGPHHAATALIPGLRAGTYPIQVDGTRRGALVIGGEPGP